MAVEWDFRESGIYSGVAFKDFFGTWQRGEQPDGGGEETINDQLAD